MPLPVEENTAVEAPAQQRLPRRRWRRRAMFALFGTLLVGVVIEAGAWAGWWYSTGGVFTWQRAADARAAARAGVSWSGPQAGGQRLAYPDCVLHPYLGFVYDASQWSDGQVSRWGFADDAPPLQKRAADRFVVGVVGGSVALDLSKYSDGTLAAALERSPRLQGRRVEVVRLAIGGYKQPQQLLAVQLAMAIGGEFDCIVCLDGFNEIALLNENVPHGVPAWFPRGWGRLMERAPTPEQQRRLGELVLLRDARRELADLADCFWWSPTAQLLWYLRDRRAGRNIAARTAVAERAAVTRSFAVTGPGPASASEAEARVEMAGVWRRCSQQLDALCKAHGALYLHFLQPNQYLAGSKPMSPAEEARAIQATNPWLPAVRHGYPLLQREGAVLQEAGVAFEDLTQIFREHREALYVDLCCHLNKSGYDILAEHIAGAIRARIEIAGVDFERLRVSPPELKLGSPAVTERFVVYGVMRDGAEYEITGSGFGTRASGNGGIVEVRGTGTVRAQRRGRGELVVLHGRHRATVPVVADWPDLVEVADGVADATGQAPRIRVNDSGSKLQIACSGLPATGSRFLVVSTQPVPPALALTSLPEFQPVVLDAPETTVPLAAPPNTGEPLFLRIVAVNQTLDLVVAASNLVIVTRG
ncbi:MAG TPA: hypothetical protein VF384_17775 [Planctomycetota bacterium]